MFLWVIRCIALAVLLPLVLTHASSSIAGMPHESQSMLVIADDLASSPLVFVRNAGQWDGDVLFRAETGGTTIWFCRDRLVYQSRRLLKSEPLIQGAGSRQASLGFKAQRTAPEDVEVEQFVTTVYFDGANPTVDVTGVDLLGDRCNYFLGDDPDRWRVDVPIYRGVTFEDIYPGVSLRIDGQGSGRAQYEWTAATSEALNKVQLRYGEAVGSKADKSALMTAWDSWDQATTLIASPADMPEAAVSRGLSEPAAAALAPDAVALVYSTLLGGSNLDGGNSVELDASGAAYVTGYTFSSNFPTQDGYDLSHNNGYDIFVTKLNQSGDALVYSTYLGGAGNDGGYDIAVDESGCAYVTGFAYSTDFPMMNAFDSSYTGSIDAVVTKLSAAGNSLVYSTYLGGTREDRGNSISIDGSECAYLTGYTSSINFPLQNAYDGSFSGGYQDVFVTKLSASGNALLYSTYLGSPADDWGYGIGVDGSGCAYVAGGTPSEEFPTLGGFDVSHNGSEDAFVAKFSAAGNSLAYCTFLGGAGEDDAFGIAVDSAGYAYVTGTTGSTDFPLLHPFDSDNTVTQIDGFVTKLSLSGNALVYSTFLGGSQNDWGSNVAIDRSGFAYVTGGTLSSDFPTRNAVQADLNGINDVFLTRFSPSGDALSYSTLLGGSVNEWGYGVAVDSSGAACLTGNTNSSDFPMVGGLGGGYIAEGDVFVTKFAALLGCCSDRVGDANGNGEDEPTIGDVSVLIDSRFITGSCDGIIECLAEADINGSGGNDPSCDDITIGDISILIDYLFITGQSVGLPDCQ